MANMEEVFASKAPGRVVTLADAGDPTLGPFEQLPGVWANAEELAGHGWNMIALPYKQPGQVVDPDTPEQKSTYRLLLNQFDETLSFISLDKNVPNRGAANAKIFDRDQHVEALQYIQHIDQIAAADFPVTADEPDTPKGAATIHHEPGLFLRMKTQTENGPTIARLATIPHGDSVLALGNGVTTYGPPSFENIGDFTPLPVGVNPDVDGSRYLTPYKVFRDAPFKGLFNPVEPLALLKGAISGVAIAKTTTLTFDTSISTGGISNIPFVVKEANATAMRAIFWIEELVNPDANGNKQFFLQYAQRVFLDFFPAAGLPGGLIRWPHITINTMKLVSRPETRMLNNFAVRAGISRSEL